MGRDFRFALRLIRKNPGFTFAIVVILGIGIGASATMFTVVDHVFIRPLPYESSDELVFVFNRYGEGQAALSPPDYMDHVERNRSFSQTGAWRVGNAVLGEDDNPERLPRLRV